MKKEEVYILMNNLSDYQIVKLSELTGSDVSIMSGKYLHYHELLNKWINFNEFSDEFNKVIIHPNKLIEILGPKPLPWYKKLLKWSITRLKNLALSIDLDYWINIIILFISYSYIIGGYNVTQWSNRTIGVFMIIVLFYDAITKLNNNKNSNKCSN